jgi:hypothetical protein
LRGDAGRRGIPRGLCGFLALRRALSPSGLEAAKSGPGSLKAAVLTCLAFTFLNPHVYLDTVLLVGGLSGRYEGTARLAFAIGAMSASFLWFFGLGYGARVLEPLFAKPSAWRVLDGLIALVMAALSAIAALSVFPDRLSRALRILTGPAQSGIRRHENGITAHAPSAFAASLFASASLARPFSSSFTNRTNDPGRGAGIGELT